MSNLETVPGGSIFASFVLDGYAGTYPDVRLDDYVRPEARVTVRKLASRCLAEPAVFTSVLSSLITDWSVFSNDLASGPARARLEENTPTGRIEAPLLIGQGEADPLVLAAVQGAYVDGRCADGQPVDYRTYPGRDHVGVVAADSPLIPDLIAWTQQRLAGEPATSTCPP